MRPLSRFTHRRRHCWAAGMNWEEISKHFPGRTPQQVSPGGAAGGGALLSVGLWRGQGGWQSTGQGLLKRESEAAAPPRPFPLRQPVRRTATHAHGSGRQPAAAPAHKKRSVFCPPPWPSTAGLEPTGTVALTAGMGCHLTRALCVYRHAMGAVRSGMPQRLGPPLQPALRPGPRASRCNPCRSASCTMRTSAAQRPLRPCSRRQRRRPRCALGAAAQWRRRRPSRA